MKIVVLGAAGQLGGAVLDAAGWRHDAVGLRRADVDVTDSTALAHALAAIAPEAIINCTAFAAVDAAEDAPVEAIAVNAIAPRTLARAAAELGATLVHYSTDFVFSGAEPGPNTEDRPPNPSGTYAVSKLIGEWLVAEAPAHYIFRVESLFGGSAKKSSVDVMLDNILGGRPVMAFADRTVSPSYVVDVAAATIASLERKIPWGLYHCVNSGETTWLGLARELARLAGRPDAEIRETNMANLAMRVRRPLNAAMSNAKLTAAGVSMPTWQDALGRYLHRR
jgi:dTDP-4-dehydrorhamnose reductase